MPPKKKIEKQQVIECAFKILKAEGYKEVTTRRLAKDLGCSTQPIYSLFENMEELKKALYEKGKAYFKEVVYQYVTGNEPPFLEIGIGYLEAARKEKEVFRFITSEHNYSLVSIKDLVKDMNLPKEKEEIVLNMWLYTHGIATILEGNKVESDQRQLREMLINAYQHFSKE